MKITAGRILNLLNTCNDVVFIPTWEQVQEMNELTKDPSVQALTDEELEILVDGDEEGQLELAKRSQEINELHHLLNQIFEGHYASKFSVF